MFKVPDLILNRAGGGPQLLGVVIENSRGHEIADRLTRAADADQVFGELYVVVGFDLGPTKRRPLEFD
jgi:hypothetical protein